MHRVSTEYEMKLLTHNRTEGIMLRHSKHSAKGFFVLTVLFCLLLSVNSDAQNNGAIHKDTSVKLVIRDPGSITDDRILLIIDDKKYYTSSFNNLFPDTSNILNVKVVKGKESIDKYGKKGKNGTISILTKKYVIEQYQKRLGAFSKKYSDYSIKQQGKDDSCTYIVDGVILPNDSRIKAEKLYNIKSQKIKKVEITENPWYNGGESRKYLVVIDIKN